MRNIHNRFIRILEIELDDLKEDIQLLIDECERQHQDGKTTPYVHKSNVAVFRSEEKGMEHFKEALRHLVVDESDDLESLIAKSRLAFRQKIQSCSLAPFIEELVERKMQKVRRYIEAK